MRAIGRLFAAAIGFMLALVAATAFLIVATVGFDLFIGNWSPLFWSQLAVYGGMAASMLGGLAFMPAAIAIAISEVLSIRSFVFHVGSGGLIGLLAVMRLDRMQERFEVADPSVTTDATLLVAAGFIGGFIYWLLAGRMAGLRPVVPPPVRENAK
jgi:hypothetical protein